MSNLAKLIEIQNGLQRIESELSKLTPKSSRDFLEELEILQKHILDCYAVFNKFQFGEIEAFIQKGSLDRLYTKDLDNAQVEQQQQEADQKGQQQFALCKQEWHRQASSMGVLQELCQQEHLQAIALADENYKNLLDHQVEQRYLHIKQYRQLVEQCNREHDEKKKTIELLRQEQLHLQQYDVNIVPFHSCSICWEPWNSTTHRLVSLSCGHTFGEQCIRDWLSDMPECPQCRAQASTCDFQYLCYPKLN